MSRCRVIAEDLRVRSGVLVSTLKEFALTSDIRALAERFFSEREPVRTERKACASTTTSAQQ